jgi:hypothetical protein
MQKTEYHSINTFIGEGRYKESKFRNKDATIQHFQISIEKHIEIVNNYIHA